MIRTHGILQRFLSNSLKELENRLKCVAAEFTSLYIYIYIYH